MTTYRTRQEIFDLAWNGLKAQGFLRSMDDGQCAYRGKKRRRCAIGHCIPDHLYTRGLEGFAAYEVDVLDAALVSTADARWARGLQIVHDEEARSKGMERRLRRFAAEHDPTIPGEA